MNDAYNQHIYFFYLNLTNKTIVYLYKLHAIPLSIYLI